MGRLGITVTRVSDSGDSSVDLMCERPDAPLDIKILRNTSVRPERTMGHHKRRHKEKRRGRDRRRGKGKHKSKKRERSPSPSTTSSSSSSSSEDSYRSPRSESRSRLVTALLLD